MVRNDAHGVDVRGFFHPRAYWFNPYLTQWLSNHDLPTTAWPNLPAYYRDRAEMEVGHGQTLGPDGWPVLPVAASLCNFDPIYLGC